MTISIRHILLISGMFFAAALAWGTYTITFGLEETRKAVSIDQQAEALTESTLSLMLLAKEAETTITPRLDEQWNNVIADTLVTLNKILARGPEVAENARALQMEIGRVDAAFDYLSSLREDDVTRGQIAFNLFLTLERLALRSNELGRLSQANISQQVTNITTVLVITVAGILAFFGGLIAAVSIMIRRPIDGLLRSIEQLSAGDLDEKAGPFHTAEIQQIADALNAATDNLRKLTVSRDELAEEILVRRQAEDEAREAYRTLEETQEKMLHVEKLSALGTFVGGVAHELNNPIMGVLNYTAFAERHANDNKTKEVLQKARSELDRMSRIVKNLLIYARSKQQDTGTSRLADVIERTLSLVEPRAAKEEVSIDVDIPADVGDVAISADSLQQILINLLTNALDGVADAEEKTIRVSAEVRDGVCRVRVLDSGDGVPESIRGKIFDPFFTTKPTGKGTGLGLSLSAQLANEAEGNIACSRKTEGRGAEFVLTLKLADKNATEERDGVQDTGD